MIATFDGWDRSSSGLTMVDDRGPDNPANPTHHRGKVLEIGQVNRIRAEVHPRTARVWVNGKLIFTWQGAASRLAAPRDYAPTRDRKQLFLGGHYGFEFHRLTVAPLPATGG